MNAHVDIVVVGSGAAGIAAAVSAARAGRSTLLLDQRHAFGGTGGFSGLTTLCGLFNDKGLFLNDGFAREFAEAINETAPVRMGKVWVLPYRPQKFRDVATRFVSATSLLQARCGEPLADVVLKADRITHVNRFAVGAVIDCSGTAEVARAVGAECLLTDETTQAPAVIFALRHVGRKFETLADAAQGLLPLARAGFPALNFQPNLEPDTITVKFAGGVDRVGELIEFMRANVAGFELCSTPLTTFVPAQRAGRMIVGQYLLTGGDVLAGRRFPDAVARCAWPIEQWNAAGAARFQYLPPGAHYEIPARSLRAARIENLFKAGKTLSGDANAIASARVMGCCLATGAAAGNLAAASLDSTHNA